MNIYTSNMSSTHVCDKCKSPVVYHMVETNPFEFDFWYYCSNPDCSNYDGETEPKDKPEWIIKNT